MFKKFLVIFALCVAFVESRALALTFSELIDIGLENHPKTKAAWWNAKRSAAIVGVAESARYPHVFFNATGIHGRDFKYINGPDTNYSIVRGDIVLSFLLYDFGEREANINSAKMALLASQWDSDLTIQKVMIEILENAFLLNYEIEVLEAIILSLKDAQDMADIAEKLYICGLNPISDVFLSKSALSLMQIELAKRKSLVEIQRGKLASSLSIAIETPLELSPLPIPSQIKLHLDKLLLIAKNHRKDLMKKRAQTAETIYFQEKVQAEFKPKLRLDARGGYDRAIGDKSNGGHYQIVLNFDVPLFNGFNTCYQKKAAYADSRLSEEEEANLEIEIALEVLTFSKTVEASQEMLFYAEENLQNAKNAYEATRNKYQIGEESIAELNAAQKQLAQARMLFSEIKSRLLVSIANLAYATGTLFPSLESLCIE